MAQFRSGQCLCGAVRLNVADPEHALSACHCATCRRWTGSALLTLKTPAERLAIEGEANIRSYASSEWAQRSFCSRCGTSLWYRETREGADYYLLAGVLDDLSGMQLESEIFIDHKPDAFAFAGPTCQLTEAEFMAALTASSKE
jgi:hypothetical protein